MVQEPFDELAKAFATTQLSRKRVLQGHPSPTKIFVIGAPITAREETSWFLRKSSGHS
jgi:hypothetical protein